MENGLWFKIKESMENEKELSGEISSRGSSEFSDPTYNVLQLVNAAVKRLDDLSTERSERTKEIFSLHKEILNLHVMYGEKLSVAESKRIDAIRAVDVGAVAIASERATQQATVLANQVAASAETLRTLVATTAGTVAAQLQSVSNQLADRIALLEKSQYETKGSGQGRKEGGQDIKSWVVLVILVAGFILTYFILKPK